MVLRGAALGRDVLRLALITFLLSGCGALNTRSRSPDVLTIALVAPLHGDFQMLGQSAYNGATLAVEGWNARGGVLGIPVELVALDGQCDFEAAQTVTQEAIEEKTVQFFVGGVCGGESEGVARIVEGLDALQVSPASVQPDLTLDAQGNVRPTVFRVPFVDPDQGLAAAQFALQRLNARRAGILYDEGSSYAASLAEAFQAAFVAGGGEVVASQTYARETLVFYDPLESIRAEAPDVLFFPGYHTVVSGLVAQARTFGLAQPVLGSDGWDSPALPLGAVDNSYFTTHFYAEEPRAAVAAWVSKYSERYLARPDALATLSYDAVNLLLEAITTAGSVDPTTVAAAMELMEFQAVSGTIRFDPSHNPYKGVVILQVSGGRLRFVEQLEPRQPEP